MTHEAIRHGISKIEKKILQESDTSQDFRPAIQQSWNELQRCVSFCRSYFSVLVVQMYKVSYAFGK